MSSATKSRAKFEHPLFQEGIAYERARIVEVAWQWIDEMRGHDSDCNCRHEATILQQFIEHTDFNRSEQ